MSIKLKSGITIPFIGLGTHGIYEKKVGIIICEAVNIGYRLIDTATSYNNHVEIGKAIKNFRSDMIICTKINENDFRNNNIKNIFDNILREFQSDYIDILLLHSPFTNLKKILNELIILKEKKYINCIGVSNFSINHLESIPEYHDQIDINQVEFHPYLNDHSLLNYCRRKKIHLIAYSPFGKGIFLKDPILKRIGGLNKKTIHQVTLNWLVSKGITTIPKSESSLHLQKNFNVLNFKLLDHEILEIDNINKMIRTCAKNSNLFK